MSNKERGLHGNRYYTWSICSRWYRWLYRGGDSMNVGDLVKCRLGVTDSVGIVLKNTGMDSVPTAWWSILWSNGKTEIVSDRNLKVINASR